MDRPVADEPNPDLQALADVRSWHRWQIRRSVGDGRAMRAHETAIAWIDEAMAAKKRHALAVRRALPADPPRLKCLTPRLDRVAAPFSATTALGFGPWPGLTRRGYSGIGEGLRGDGCGFQSAQSAMGIRMDQAAEFGNGAH